MNINLTLFVQAAVFAVFIWATMKFIWPPMRGGRAGPALAGDIDTPG